MRTLAPPSKSDWATSLLLLGRLARGVTAKKRTVGDSAGDALGGQALRFDYPLTCNQGLRGDCNRVERERKQQPHTRRDLVRRHANRTAARAAAVAEAKVSVAYECGFVRESAAWL